MPNAHELFRGSHTVLATPFTADGSGIDTDALRRLLDWQIESGSHGLIPLGSTGEFLSVSDAERTQVVENRRRGCGRARAHTDWHGGRVDG